MNEPQQIPASLAIIDVVSEASEDIVSDASEENRFIRYLKIMKENIKLIAIVGALLTVTLVLTFWLRSGNKTSEPSQSQTREISKEHGKETIPELNYSEINRLEMEKLSKVQEISPSAPVQQPKQKEFWPTFFDILTDKVVGKPPEQKPKVSNVRQKSLPEKKIEKSEPEVSLPATELPKKQVASKPPVQKDVPKKVSQSPAKKSAKSKVTPKLKQTSSKIQWIPAGKDYVPVMEGNVGFTGSHEPNISKPGGWEGAKWRLLGTKENCYWGLVK